MVADGNQRRQAFADSRRDRIGIDAIGKNNHKNLLRLLHRAWDIALRKVRLEDLTVGSQDPGYGLDRRTVHRVRGFAEKNFRPRRQVDRVHC
jgi:hypothetical protein